MKIRLHPVLLPVFFLLIVTGGISMYAILFISLLIHELGHMIAARLVRMRIRSCTIMPYGGELVFYNRLSASKKARLIVALGGPVATLLLLVLALLFSFPGEEQVIKVQLALLALNLLPVLPLDGGQALVILFEKKDSPYGARTLFLIYSMIMLAVAILLLTTAWPDSLPFLLLALFLLIQNIMVFRFRRYERAFTEMKLKRLT